MRRRPLQMLGKHFCALNRRRRLCAAALSRSHIFPMPKANVVKNEVHPSSTCRVCPQVRGKQVSAGIAHLRCQTYKHRDLFSYSTQSSHPPPPPCTPSFSSPSNTPESGDSVYVLRLLRPILGFVQIGLFASPELPISALRHHRVEGRADVEEESPRGEGTGEGGGEFHHC